MVDEHHIDLEEKYIKNNEVCDDHYEPKDLHMITWSRLGGL